MMQADRFDLPAVNLKPTTALLLNFKNFIYFILWKRSNEFIGPEKVVPFESKRVTIWKQKGLYSLTSKSTSTAKKFQI
jgi:hypothetical protein